MLTQFHLDETGFLSLFIIRLPHHRKNAYMTAHLLKIVHWASPEILSRFAGPSQAALDALAGGSLMDKTGAEAEAMKLYRRSLSIKDGTPRGNVPLPPLVKSRVQGRPWGGAGWAAA
jgi:hypothetical protein